MDAGRTAERLLEALGGAGNLAATTHCATRLRITPRDLARVDRAAIAQTDGVVAVQVVAGQVQIVLGPGRVEAVHAELTRESGASPGALPGAGRHGRRRGPAAVVGLVVDVFTPLLPAFVAGGLLTAIHNVLAGPGVFGEASVVELVPAVSGVVALVGLLGSAVFALLPVLLGFSATARFGGTPYLGAALGAALVAAPLITASGSLPGIHLAPSTGWVIAGVDVLAIDYQGTVLPMIVIAAVLARFEALFTALFARVLRGSARLLLVPLATLLCSGLVAFVVLGPVLRYAGDIAAEGMEWVYASAGTVGGAIVGAVYSPLVVTGLHQGLIAIELGLIASGGSFIFPIAAAANLAQAAACLAVWVAAVRGSRLSALAASATAPAALGIAEPAMFAVTLRLRVPFVIAVASTTVAAALLATFRVEAVTLGAAGVFGFASIAPGRVTPFVLCLLVAIAGSFGGTFAWARWRAARGRPLGAESPAEPAAASAGLVTLSAPVAGAVVDVGTLGDPAFAASALGATSAIRPSEGIVAAPVAGVVTAVSATRHAYGITTPGGVEVLVHIGIDTVRMDGAGFAARVATGDPVTAGQELALVDIAAVAAAGLDPVVLTIVTNREPDAVTAATTTGDIERGGPVLIVAESV